MSTHPNAILMVALTPDDLPMKTYREIMKASGVNDLKYDDFKIGGKRYNHLVMESSYDEGLQVSAKVGDIVILDMVTYGYGDVIKWADLKKQEEDLEAWAVETCKTFKCSYEIFVTANYW